MKFTSCASGVGIVKGWTLCGVVFYEWDLCVTWSSCWVCLIYKECVLYNYNMASACKPCAVNAWLLASQPWNGELWACSWFRLSHVVPLPAISRHALFIKQGEFHSPTTPISLFKLHLFMLLTDIPYHFAPVGAIFRHAVCFKRTLVFDLYLTICFIYVGGTLNKRPLIPYKTSQ